MMEDFFGFHSLGFPCLFGRQGIYIEYIPI